MRTAFVSEHLVELWGENGTMYTLFCLVCGWQGGDSTRAEAETEGRMHERRERQPWQFEPGSIEPWKPGNPNAPKR